MPDITTIPLSKPTRDRLRALGKKGESYDTLLNRMMDVYVNRTVEFEPVSEPPPGKGPTRAGR